MGRRQRDHLHATGADGRRRERYRRSREPRLEALQGDGHPARRPAPAEHRRHRGATRAGHRQVREAGRPDRIARADDEPRADPTGRRPLRHQVPRRGHLLAPSAQQGHDPRDGRDHAPRAGARGRPGRPHPMPRAAEHPGRPVPDDPGRHGPGDRRPRHGQGGVQLGHPGLRRRCGQLDHGHRRDG